MYTCAYVEIVCCMLYVVCRKLTIANTGGERSLTRETERRRERKRESERGRESKGERGNNPPPCVRPKRLRPHAFNMRAFCWYTRTHMAHQHQHQHSHTRTQYSTPQNRTQDAHSTHTPHTNTTEHTRHDTTRHAHDTTQDTRGHHQEWSLRIHFTRHGKTRHVQTQ